MSRLLAYSTDRMGVPKALGSTGGITEKLVPAVAKFAQDGSQDAREGLDKNCCLDCFLRNLPSSEDFICYVQGGPSGRGHHLVDIKLSLSATVQGDHDGLRQTLDSGPVW